MAAAEQFAVRRIAVLADCHVHPGGGPDWTPAVLEALGGVDTILTLGDMGESAGLDRLAEIAPVTGVAGMDDQPDPRTELGARCLEVAGQAVGLIFDPKAAGLAVSLEPFVPAPGWRDRAAALFGRPIDILLHASTHRPAISQVDGVLVVDPGSALLPAGQELGARGAFARLVVGAAGLTAEIVQV